ncbi:MAG TPA: MerR family transcriptional regulator [Acidobacteriota bacterium]|nr:MerR family transcriptional regulator [Acidobacteriota bacterium]
MTEKNLTLEELSQEVEKLLDQRNLLDVQRDGRVSAVPDARTIRYYTTLGLLERPRIVDRQASYGKRHVLQLLAIKSLQGMSMPLEEIQSRLYGKSDRELEAILESISNKRKTTKSDIHPIVWREIMIEPGLKIMAEEKWQLIEEEALLKKIRTAFAAFQTEEKQ